MEKLNGCEELLKQIKIAQTGPFKAKDSVYAKRLLGYSVIGRIDKKLYRGDLMEITGDLMYPYKVRSLETENGTTYYCNIYLCDEIILDEFAGVC